MSTLLKWLGALNLFMGVMNIIFFLHNGNPTNLVAAMVSIGVGVYVLVENS